MNALWVLIVFLLGAATGALTLSIYRAATISRTREAFQADLDKMLEEHSNPMAGKSPPATKPADKTQAA